MSNPTPIADAGPDARLSQAMAAVRSAVQANDLPRASTLAREALGAGVEHPTLLNLRALWHEEQGRLSESLADLDRAEGLDPSDYTVRNAKGILLSRMQRVPEAVAAFEAATAQAPRFAEAFYNLGSARETTGDLRGARLAYEQALAARPGFADALARLSALALNTGHANAARVHAEQALRIDPHHVLATLSLADAEQLEGDGASAKVRLAALAERPGLGPYDRAMVHGALGDAFEAEGRFADAFAAYEAGNAQLRAAFAPVLATNHGQSVSQMLLWMVDYFSKASPQAWAPRATASTEAGGGAARHVFVVGFPTSGARRMAAGLAGRSGVVALEDQDTLADAVRDFMADKDDLDFLAKAADEALDAYRRAYWRRVRESGVEPTGKVFVDVQPLNAIKLPVISRLFPGAKVVFALRDPRDTVLDAFFSRFPLNASNYELLTLDSCSVFYDLVTRFGLICVERLHLDTGMVRFEDFTREPEAQVRAVCDFLGLEYDAEEAAGASPAAIGGGEGRWRQYQEQLAKVADILDPWIERFGYPKA